MTRAADHHIDCEWHHDQYDFECTCGATRASSEGQEQSRELESGIVEKSKCLVLDSQLNHQQAETSCRS